ncbi:AAA family ATPase [Candidatus Woesearchaeota archaeon]|jgi:adenylate cyclase class IV/nicotinamide riboside kinase|nr:AAA family ATPase [Candidatus Woesearchaeota archaeon]MBT4110420.1 AAA family ATPase [Candidatus Woesearchaeota archaeon]MBT4336056.1 AAA family ATPase [Candidatus Woesearchaeota archaeon]MBT4468965.1 AAA family ATPase [Candidatus Woesearchaeota archaeon]MBT6744716.1 AAA family ATPase [Candidatus Woesearchaeota archaeon]
MSKLLDDIVVLSILGPQGSGKSTVFKKLRQRWDKNAIFLPDIAEECPIDLTDKKKLHQYPELGNLVTTWMTCQMIKAQIDAIGPRIGEGPTTILQDINPLSQLVYPEAIKGSCDEHIAEFVKEYCALVPQNLSFIIPGNLEFLVDDGKRDVDPKYQKKVEDTFRNVFARHDFPHIFLPSSPTAQVWFIDRYLAHQLGQSEEAPKKVHEIEIKCLLTPEEYRCLDRELNEGYQPLCKETVETLKFTPGDHRVRIREGETTKYEVVIKEGDVVDHVRTEYSIHLEDEIMAEQVREGFASEGMGTDPKWVKHKQEFAAQMGGYDYVICLQEIENFGYLLEVEKMSSVDDSHIHVPNLKQIISNLGLEPIGPHEFQERVKDYIRDNQ